MAVQQSWDRAVPRVRVRVRVRVSGGTAGLGSRGTCDVVRVVAVECDAYLILG